jgi:hypothetical protein
LVVVPAACPPFRRKMLSALPPFLKLLASLSPPHFRHGFC